MQHKVLLFAISSCFLLNGCLGTGVLKRGTDDGKGVLETPSLHTVPERPKKLEAGEREAMTQDMRQSFEKDKEDF